MKRRTLPLTILITLLAISLSLFALEDEKEAEAKKKAAAPKAPQIEVCFVLDTTGSMGGLIKGAKTKIWSIVEDMQEAKPKPEIKMGLVAYRDRGDKYVTKVFGLSDDLDAQYDELLKFEAGGGGDTPESVNQGLHEAVTQMNWSEDKKTYRVVFLVGDAPPQMKYPDDVKYPKTCELAKKKDILINTVQCGNINGTQLVWTEIAQNGGGKFAAIKQNGGVQVVNTPFDKEINELNVKINGTVVAFGTAKAQMACTQKLSNAMRPDAYANASRASWNVRNNRGKAITGKEDLVAEWEDKNVDLKELKKEELPVELQKLKQVELVKHIEEQSVNRKKLMTEMAACVAKRDAYIKTETEKQRVAGALKDSFDENVRQMVREQGSAKGLNY